jgi:hypothetical protein
MGKPKEFWRRNKAVIIGGTITVLSFVGGALLDGAFRKPKKVTEKQLLIQPDYYETLDGAIDAFKEKQKITKHAALFEYDGSYGVYDEAPVLGEPR